MPHPASNPRRRGCWRACVRWQEGSAFVRRLVFEQLRALVLQQPFDRAGEKREEGGQGEFQPHLRVHHVDIARDFLAERAHVEVHAVALPARADVRSEEHTSELQSLMRISYAVFCLKKKNNYLYHILFF